MLKMFYVEKKWQSILTVDPHLEVNEKLDQHYLVSKPGYKMS